jgi:hypothetical protein
VINANREVFKMVEVTYTDIEEIKKVLNNKDCSLLMLQDLKHFVDSKIKTWGTTSEIFRIM